ncbi:MAG: biotin carboxylase, partial [Planctomycetota bacterium]
MNVLMISPSFPEDLAFFTRGLAQTGARVFGVGDQPLRAMHEDAQQGLTDYLQVASLWQEEAVVDQIKEWLRGRQIHRVECLWEPGVVLAAKLRAALGAPGLNVKQADAFRDKDRMKAVLDEAGVRTPRHARASTSEQIREYSAEIGYPLIIKPIDGAGSADTYPVRSDEDLEEALSLIGHVPEVSVEEFIEGREFTYDTLCSNGDMLFDNISWYRPKPLTARLNPWISPQAVSLRDTDCEEYQKGRELGLSVLKALNFESGITHMEWFLTPDGEAVFGEIGARAPGGRLTHVMNYSCDLDLFHAWGEAVALGR